MNEELFDDWEDRIPPLVDFARLDRICKQKDFQAFKVLSFEDKVYCLHTAYENKFGKEVIILFPGDISLPGPEPRVIIKREEVDEKFIEWSN